MSFSINTNVASLQAQNYLRVNSNFQGKTINEVTSGLRIVNSGDDAAGLAIANGFRSDEAVLTQGIQNANNGLSQLQIIDGGINNISQLLDRARTLATQSASGTFTGDRGVLNSEFQSVLGEIDRQAQSIGLNQGGTFAKNLSIFIGGGKGPTSASVINNGSVSVNLSASTVDSKSLGLSGVQAIGVAGTDIGAGSASTSVANILAIGANTTSEAVAGSTVFYFQGPGFSGANKIGVAVNLSGVSDATTLAAAINTGIQNAGNSGSQFATAFKNANVTAAINTDINGKQQLTFSSSVASFQTEAGDRVANAFLGNFSSGATGVALTNTATGNAASAVDATAFGAGGAGTIVVRIQGGGLAGPQDIQLTVGAATTVAQAVTNLTAQVAGNAALQAAGITVATHSSGTALVFTSNRGEGIEASAVGDVGNQLGLGSFSSGNTATNFDNTEYDSAAATLAAGTTTFEISIGGGAAVAGTITDAGTTQAEELTNLNAEFTTVPAFQSAQLVATAVDATHIKIVSSNGTSFRYNALTDGAGTGLGSGGVGGSGATASSPLTGKSTFDSGGSSVTGPSGFNPSDVLYFGALRNGSDVQTVTVSATDATGNAHSLAVTLNNTNARSLDEALNTINSQLQQSNDSTLNQIAAVKEQGTVNNTAVEGLRFTSTLNAFKVSLGTVADNTATSAVGIAEDQAVNTGAANFVQGGVFNSVQSAGGGASDVSSQATAEAAVSALATSVSTLGSAQAAVGRGENQFNYAINLAQSELTNETTAESGLRDADLAAAAANLTKAQILLQAGVAALAQANAAPQNVLALLKG
jgi:flagellin